MNRKTAFGLLRLNPNSSLAEIKKRRRELIKEAQAEHDEFMREQYMEAYKTILETKDEIVSTSPAFIGSNSANVPPARQMVFPYQEPLIRERIAALPDRVTMKCSVTGHHYSVQFVFDKGTNKYHFKNPLPQAEDVLFADVELPVAPEDLTEGTTINVQDATELRGSIDQHFAANAASKEIGLVNKAYSANTAMDGFKKMDHRNDAEFGHNHACCHCGMRTYVQCSKCGNYTCSNLEQPSSDWPLQWSHITEDQEVPCPHCKEGEIKFRNPKMIANGISKRHAQGAFDPADIDHGEKIFGTATPQTEAKIAHRRTSNQKSIGQEKREAITHDPVKQIGHG